MHDNSTRHARRYHLPSPPIRTLLRSRKHVQSRSGKQKITESVLLEVNGQRTFALLRTRASASPDRTSSARNHPLPSTSSTSRNPRASTIAGRRPNPTRSNHKFSQRTDASKMNAAHLPCRKRDLAIPMSIACHTNAHRKQRKIEPHTKGAAPSVSQYPWHDIGNQYNAHTDISSNASSDADMTMDPPPSD